MKKQNIYVFSLQAFETTVDRVNDVFLGEIVITRANPTLGLNN